MGFGSRLTAKLESVMPKVRASSIAVSLDGYAAGPDQSFENPLGVRGTELFEWFFATQTWQRMRGHEGGSTGIDDEWAGKGMENAGAWILGRNMFGPVRGPWLDDSWKGWWGEEPPFHVPAFVLTHHPRRPIEMKGGTTFHFVADGIGAALQLAKEAAKDKDVRIGGGVATIQQYLRARLIDEVHLAFRPILMGSGENLFAGIDLRELGYRCTGNVSSELAMHVLLKKDA
jgi:dihydrofolate reductase